MRETRSSGSVRGASGDGRPYRESKPVILDKFALSHHRRALGKGGVGLRKRSCTPRSSHRCPRIEFRWSKDSAAVPIVAGTGGGERRKIAGKQITPSAPAEKCPHGDDGVG
jgi:hypothetical protein